ncbi:unnamed protein product [Durusdinium trenchii]|uniref:Uncharacterized protein n=1 Tax=Durusdinium trenchii TaxID=1381693 RepID=A0ABP0JU70_9DINO
MDFLGVNGFLLTLCTILNQEIHGLSLWAPDCGSWGIPARSTSGRSYMNPLGHHAYKFVSRANTMVSRLVLCLMLCLSRNLKFLVEQPHQSLLYMHNRWQYLANRVAWVFQTFFWMQLHGGSSPKRTVFMGNVRSIDRLNKGKLTKSVRTKKTKIKTTRKYIDKSGQRRFVGDKKQLKATQAYPSGLGESIHEMYQEELTRHPRGDLRFRIVPDPEKTDLELFLNMELADTWPDADLKDTFDFLMGCKHTRTCNLANAESEKPQKPDYVTGPLFMQRNSSLSPPSLGSFLAFGATCPKDSK